MLADFHWLRPEWLLALPLVAALALIMARRQLAPGNWQRVVDPALAPYVLSRSPGAGADYRWLLLFLCGVLATLALAGPSWNRVEQPVFRSKQALVIALDLSSSMDAEDVTPSRLARARLKVLDILEQRPGGKTALVVYSGNAFTVTPLTTDTDTIAALVNSLSTDIMPSLGSNPVAAIEKGRQLLEQGGVKEGEVLLITDGGASKAAERAAAGLRDAGYSLSILGVGTLAGAPIPLPGGGFVTDRAGRIAVPKLETKGLRSLADAGGGRFTVMTTDNHDIETLRSDAVERGTASGNDLTTDQWQEEGPWLLLLLLPLAALAFRRGWVLVAVLFLMPIATPAEAFDWDDLWKTNDQQAREQLAAGRAAEAAALFDDREWQGVARYRAGDYAKSAEAFAGRKDANSLYNFGNALARQGEFEAAIDAYDRALEIEPNAEDAEYNRNLLQKMLDQQRGQSKGDRQPSSKKGGQSKQSNDGSQSDQAGEEGRQGDSGSEWQPGNSSLRSGDEMSQEDLEAVQRELDRAAREAEKQAGDNSKRESKSPEQLAAARRAQEKQQALEQWLRRVPDDPGGLLRRKFRYQYQRQGVDQDGNSLWSGQTGDPW